MRDITVYVITTGNIKLACLTSVLLGKDPSSSKFSAFHTQLHGFYILTLLTLELKNSLEMMKINQKLFKLNK